MIIWVKIESNKYVLVSAQGEATYKKGELLKYFFTNEFNV